MRSSARLLREGKMDWVHEIEKEIERGGEKEREIKIKVREGGKGEIKLREFKERGVKRE